MLPITIRAIRYHVVALPLVEPLRTSFGEVPIPRSACTRGVTPSGTLSATQHNNSSIRFTWLSGQACDR